MSAKAVITWVAPGLFEASRYLAPQAPATRDHLSPDRRRTVRQAMDLAKGVHPLTGGPLHHDAAPVDDRKAPGHRCGTCRFRVAGRYAKCWWPNVDRPGGHPRVSFGAATDVRSWWPACADHETGPS